MHLLLLLECWHWVGTALARHHQRCGEATAALSPARSISLHWEGGLGASTAKSIFLSSSLSSSSSRTEQAGAGGRVMHHSSDLFPKNSAAAAPDPSVCSDLPKPTRGKIGFGNGKPEKVGMRMLSPRKALGKVTSTSMMRQNRSHGSAALPTKLPWINVHNEGCGCHRSLLGSRKNSAANHFG